MNYTKEDLEEAKQLLDDLQTHRYRMWVECNKCGKPFETQTKRDLLSGLCILCRCNIKEN